MLLAADSFIANEAHWFTPDVIYLVFVRNGTVAGARVGGQTLATSAARVSTKPTFYAEPELLLRWAGADPAEPEFLMQDRKNFRYSIAEIREAHLIRRRALWTWPIPNSGSVAITPREGRRRRLILLGQQDTNAIHSLLLSGGLPVSPLAA